MAGLWILGLVLLIAALPVLLVYLWFRFRRFPIPAFWFLLSLLAGAFSVLLAALLQGLFFRTGSYASGGVSPGDGLGTSFFTVFIRIALPEETGRILALGLLFRLARAGKGVPLPTPSKDTGKSGPGEELLGFGALPQGFGAATGLVAGLGFALIENASYGASDIMLALLRAFTAAPLHGACGARIGMGLLGFREGPYRGFWRFLSAVIIHGMYNLMVISPGIPPILPILIAFSALFTAMQVIRSYY
ncbi:MAG: PrsW family intramembrane metalloprotease [Treponema sp.]|jgi:RsiW-degrading membrane proteinase PrsW (M82 family)|nr:PrsW family intramembrane metalloprotease [Treponema sp.]